MIDSVDKILFIVYVDGILNFSLLWFATYVYGISLISLAKVLYKVIHIYAKFVALQGLIRI